MTTATRAAPKSQPGEPGVRVPAEDRQVADAAGLGPAGGGHPARGRRRLHQRVRPARGSTRGVCVLDGAPSACDVEGAVGDPVAAGVDRRTDLHLPADPAGVRGADLRCDAADLRDRRRPGLGQERRRGRAGRRDRLPRDERDHRRRRRGAGDRDHHRPRPGDARHERLRRHRHRRHRGLPVQPVLPHPAAALPGLLRGKRFVPIVTAFAAIALGIVLAFVWPPIGYLIENGANGIVQANTPLAVFVYGLVERALSRSGCTTSGTPRSSSPSTSALGGLQRHPDLLLRRTPGVRHPRRRVPVQDVRPVRRGPGDLADGAAREPGPHRLDHDGGRR